MKGKNVIGVIVFVIVGAVLLLIAGCKSDNSFEGLKLVAEYKPFQLYVYADTASTNPLPNIIVREGDDPIYMRECESNEMEIRHFEKANEVLLSCYGANGQLLRRDLWYYQGYNPMFTYVDTNGDGLFDFFIKGYDKPIVFTRSNLCWVPVVQTVHTN